MIRVDESARFPDVARVCDNVISAIKKRLGYAGSDALRSSRYDRRFLFACHISLLGCFEKERMDLNSSNSVVAGISTFGPIISRLFGDIRNPGNRLHILQT